MIATNWTITPSQILTSREIALVLVIIMIVFGVGKLPQVGGAIGKGLRAFKKGQRGEDEDELEEAAPVKPARKKTTKS